MTRLTVVPDVDQIPRWAAASHAAASLIPGEHAAVRKIADIDDPVSARFTLLARRLGDLAESIAAGEPDLDGRLLSVAASALAWIDHNQAARAR